MEERINYLISDISHNNLTLSDVIIRLEELKGELKELEEFE